MPGSSSSPSSSSGAGNVSLQAGSMFVHEQRVEVPLPRFQPSLTGVSKVDAEIRRRSEMFEQEMHREFSAFSQTGLKWLEQRAKEDIQVATERAAEDAAIARRRAEEDGALAARRQCADMERRKAGTFESEREAQETELISRWKSKSVELQVSLKEMERAIRTAEQAAARLNFVNKPLLTGELKEVPGLDEVSINTLNRSGIFTTYQLIGKFLEFGRDAERLHTWLVFDMGCHGLVRDMGCNAPSMTRLQTAQQIARRVLIKGFKCEIKLSDGVIKSSHSHFGDDKKRAFMNKKLTGNLTVDFTGIGPVSLKNLAAAGITNSDGLFAAFLSIIDNPNPMANIDKCDQFYEQLGRYGVASGYKATIIYQLQSKLAVGIDSSNVGIDNCQLWTLDFVNKPRLTGELKEVPGVGEVSINTLNRSGIFTTYQLIGKFLEFGRDAERLHTWLVRDMGCHAPSMTTHQTAQQIAKRVLIKGFENCQQLDAIPEYSSPHTGEQSRALPPRPPQTGRELFPSLD